MWKSSKSTEPQLTPHQDDPKGLLGAVRVCLAQEWKGSAAPLPPYEPRFSDSESTTLQRQVYCTRGPEPPNMHRPRWWSSDDIIIDMEGVLSSKQKVNEKRSVTVFSAVVYKRWMGAWIPIRIVLKCWMFERIPTHPTWPRVPSHWVDILGHNMLSSPLYLGHVHLVCPRNRPYTVLATVRAQSTLYHYCAQSPHTQLFHAQIRSFLAQILFYELPKYRKQHSFQHNDLKLDNIVFTTESETNVLHVSYSFSTSPRPPIVMSIPTYGKRIHMIDYEHASFCTHHPDFVFLSTHTNSKPLRIQERSSLRDVLMVLLTIPHFHRWSDPRLASLLEPLARHLQIYTSQDLNTTLHTRLYGDSVDPGTASVLVDFLHAFADQYRSTPAPDVVMTPYCWDDVWG